MLELFFSFHFISISLLTACFSVVVAYLCARLQQQLLQALAGQWLVEHIYCPLARVLILAIMSLLLFPAIVATGYHEMTALFFDREYLTDMVNILMVTSLLISFFPLISHPGISLPILGCIATAILIKQFFGSELPDGFNPLPDATAGLKMVLLLVVIYWGGRWLIHQLATYIDQRYLLTGSRIIVTDVVYLVMQIPVILAYAHSLLTANGLAPG